MQAAEHQWFFTWPLDLVGWPNQRIWGHLVTTNDSALVGTGYQALHRIVLDVEIALGILRQMGFAQGEYGSTGRYIHFEFAVYVVCLSFCVLNFMVYFYWF